MRKFGLIGYPLSHSFSPSYFAEKFAREGHVDCLYEAYPIKSIAELLPLINDQQNLEGINVTIPYKKLVIPFLSESTKAVGRMSACNCIKIKNGRLKGYNTDVTGFERSLIPHLTEKHTKAIILGTGGAAAAVEYVLEQLHIEYLFVSRGGNAGEKQLSYHSLTRELLQEYKLIINSTPLGMYPDINSFPDIPYQYLGKDHYLYDLVYNPAETIFLKKGAAKGAITKNGADMLLI